LKTSAVDWLDQPMMLFDQPFRFR